MNYYCPLCHCPLVEMEYNFRCSDAQKHSFFIDKYSISEYYLSLRTCGISIVRSGDSSGIRIHGTGTLIKIDNFEWCEVMEVAHRYLNLQAFL